MILADGTNLKQLDSTLMEFFNPGEKVELLLGVDHPLNLQELNTFSAYFRDNGFPLISASEGSTSDWPHAIRLEFRRPLRPSGVAVFPLVLLLVGAAATIGVLLMGWKIGTIADRISKQLPLLAGITAATIIAIVVIKSKEREKTRA